MNQKKTRPDYIISIRKGWEVVCGVKAGPSGTHVDLVQENAYRVHEPFKRWLHKQFFL